ncbi:MAG: hypothetical protein QM767_18050 [Anaeromyxobacter sp.]
MELLLDRGNLLHAGVALVLVATGLLAAWIGIRDGFVRKAMRTSGGHLSGRQAMVAGALYVVTGLAGAVGGVLFFLR